MNDTPRVDETILKSNGQWSYALVHVARQLERELEEAQECLREAMQAMIGTLANGNKWPERWRKAAGMEEEQ
jgi:hypothetical protein